MSDWRERLDEFEREARENLEQRARGRAPWCRAVERLFDGRPAVSAGPTPSEEDARRQREYFLDHYHEIDDVEVLRYLLHLALMECVAYENASREVYGERERAREHLDVVELEGLG